MKKLLFSLMFAGISAVTFNAQVWDLADATKFTTATIAVPTTLPDGLKFNGASGSADFAITASAYTFSDTFVAAKRVQFGGNSYGGSTNPAVGATAMPTKKWLEVPVPANYILKIWSRAGGVRNIIISSSAGLVLSSTAFAASGDASVISYKNTGGSATLLISTGAGDNYIYKIEVAADPTMAVNDVKSGVKANAFSNGNRIYVSNLESKNTDIKVYSLNGSLVKSVKSTADTNFEINGRGVYIVNLKSEAGEKSVKVLIK